MKNLEIKSKYDDHKFAVAAAKKLGAKYHGILNQTDTYFNIVSGRMKMRVINNKTYELIHYYRANSKNARYSNYEIINLNNGIQVYNLLKTSLGIKCAVVKKRKLYIFENVRIHLDTVRYLGKFLEFEVVCKTVEDKKAAGKKMKFLMDIFKIKSNNLVKSSYSDLILS